MHGLEAAGVIDDLYGRARGIPVFALPDDPALVDDHGTAKAPRTRVVAVRPPSFQCPGSQIRVATTAMQLLRDECAVQRPYSDRSPNRPRGGGRGGEIAHARIL